MANTVGSIDSSHSALLVLDISPATLKTVSDNHSFGVRVKHAVAIARDNGILVAYVRMALKDSDLQAMPAQNKLSGHLAASGDALKADSPTSAIPDQVAPEDGDLVIRKTRVGAFSNTDLEAQLHKRGIGTVILAGISTSGVVLSTVRDAADRDYRVFVLSDGSADPQPDVHDFLLARIFPSQAEVVTIDQFGTLLKPGASIAS